MRYIVLLVLCVLSTVGCELFDELFSPGDAEVVAPTTLRPGVIVPTLRVGVKVRISVVASGEPVMEEAVKEVSTTGDIVLPYIQQVHCAGMTIEAFQEELTKRYREFYVDPVVSAYYVPMSEGGSSPYGSVLVTGCVGRPGVVSIPPTCDLTVMQALQLSGGIGEWADANGVRVTRSFADGTKQRVIIDTERVGRSGAAELNIILMPGDIVNVPESNF